MSFTNSRESGRPITVKDEGVILTNNVSSFDFTGAGISGSASGDDVTENVTGGGGGGGSGYQIPTGTVDGSNKVFIYGTAPSAIVVDGVTLRQTHTVNGVTTVNWTGTTTVTMTVAPTNYTFAIG